MRRIFLIVGVLVLSSPITFAQIKIVPIGNSITQGNVNQQGQNSYRRNLWHKLIDGGYSVDFVGSLDTDMGGFAFPDPTFDHDHEGHWGWRADEILAELPGWLTGYTADVALIHLGSNDAIQGNTVNSTLNELEAIIGVLRNDNPQITIFLAQILPLENSEWNARVEGINQGLVSMASNLDQPQSRIILVDQNTGWSIASFTYDGVHPNPAGEERMAQRWYDAFDAFNNPENVAPIITAQNPLTINEDQSLTLSVSDFSIEDPDSAPADMTLAVNGGENYLVDGTTITPEEDWYGTLNVQVTVSDGSDVSNPFTAIVDVIGVNDPPVITGQGVILSMVEDSQLALQLSSFIVSDPDSGPVDMSLNVSAGSHYTVEGTLIIPDDNWHGTLSVPVTVSDGLMESDPFEASITVNSINDAPVITDIPDQTILKGEQFETIDLGIYVEDDDTADSLINWTVIGASRLSVTILDQEAMIVPVDTNWTGTESIVFIATDGDPTNSLSSLEQTEFTIRSTVSVDETLIENFNLYPNPSKGKFTIRTEGGPGDLVIFIFDSQGRLVKQRTTKHVNLLFEDLHGFPDGVYHIKVIANESFHVLKLIKD
jgi:lysophospholipase L1-like esterase